ncbi:type II toxin-antitoxin system RelE/ParE family toxin [Erythrobacter sp.]|uniref:type II toxin-antitoxin system RelE/ParE family toxin n=1 Tax=Erythrobacter sp. TaxID=1042 RepID=UPI002EBFE47B|nr:type II toxin-antitoxin system RelE/ParE family toxin [Erythrobacter sp.]
MNIDYTQDALADIGEIGAYIAEDDTEQARLFVDRLREFIEGIAENPRRFRLRSEWGRNVRAANFRNYLIIFEHDDVNILILRVASGRRNMIALLSESKE